MNVSQEIEGRPLDGREAVAYFSTCYHSGRIQFMHFNIAASTRYMPYNLVHVPENKV